MLSTYISSNFRLSQVNDTTLQVPAGTNSDLVAASIRGRPRWIEAAVSAAHPGGAAGTYDVHLTTTDDAFHSVGGPPPAEVDDTNHAFGLQIVAAGGTPGGAWYRRVGVCGWDGSKITSVVTLARAAPVPVGFIFEWTGSGDPPGGIYVQPDGRLIDRTTYAEFYAVTGHKYNGGVDPGSNKVKIPDRRGRTGVGPDDMGTAQGAASRVLTSALAGQSGGEEKHALTLAELAAHAHSPGTLSTNTAGNHQHRSATGGIDLLGTVNNGSGTIQYFVGDGGAFMFLTATNFAGNHTHTVAAGATASAGSGTGHNNMPPFETENLLVRIA
jgi:microcystin-dependent protein